MIQLKNVKLRPKLIGILLLVGLLPLTIAAVWAVRDSSAALMDSAFSQMEGVREIKAAQVEDFFEERRGDMEVVSHTVANLEENAFDRMRVSQKLKKSHVNFYLNNLLRLAESLAENPHAADGLEAGRFSAVKGAYGDWFEEYLGDYGFYDLFLINPQGRVIYTVSEESDLGGNVLTGRLADSPLGKAFRRGREKPVLQDYESYEPSGGEPAAFAAAPVYRNGRYLGVAAVQIPKEPINEIVQAREGMGRTGETYLAAEVGERREFRSDMQTMGDGRYVIGYDLGDSAPASLLIPPGSWSW